MNTLFDTHSHLYDEKYEEDRDIILGECTQKLKGWINVGADLKSSLKCQSIAQQYLFDTQIIIEISNEDEMEIYAKMGIDGVLFSSAIERVV